MIAFFKRLRTSPILQAGTLLTAMSVLTGIVAYAFQVVMGRMLAPHDFTLFNATLALSSVICSPIGAPQAVLSRQVAMTAARHGRGSVRGLYRRWARWICVGCGIVVLIVAVAGPLLKDALRLPDLQVLWLLTGMVAVNILAILAGTFLHGLQAFRWLGFVPFGAVIVKIVSCVVLVMFCGWGLHGALGGVLISLVIACLASLWGIERIWAGANPGTPVAAPFAYKLVAPIAAAGIGLTTMSQIDLVLVNQYFQPEIASQYAPAAVLGKAVLYLPAGLATAIMPIVAASDARRERSAGHALQAIAATALLCGAAAVFYVVTGPAFMKVLYGDKYGQAGNLLMVYGLAMVPMALAMVLQGFLFARGRAAYCWVIAGLAIAEVALIHAWHPSLYAIIGVVGGFNTALAVVGLILMAAELRSGAEVPQHGSAAAGGT